MIDERVERIANEVVEIARAWKGLRASAQKLKTVLDPWFVLFSEGGCRDALFKRRDGQRRPGQKPLSDRERALLFAREVVELRQKAAWRRVHFYDFRLYKVDMIKKIVGMQVLMKDISEEDRAQAEKEYMEARPWSYEYFKELQAELDRRADIILNAFYKSLRKSHPAEKFNPINRIQDFS